MGMGRQKLISYLWHFLIILLLHINAAFGQSQHSDLRPSSLKVKGLDNEKLLLKLYVGNFSGIKFNSDETRNSLILLSYLQSYNNYCYNSLPPDKVELKQQVCRQWYVTKNGWGQEISRSCTAYRTEGTGVFASPKMYRAKLQFENRLTEDALHRISQWMAQSQSNPMSGVMHNIDMVKFRLSIQRDMNYLMEAHPCKSPELMHFQENLRLYILGKEPIRLDYDKALFAGPKPPAAPKNQNYSELLEDLVYQESKSWMMNQYVRGSISDVSISSTDQAGYPSRVMAKYIFKGGFNSKKFRGSVTVTFDSGIPECLYFFDFPNRCRPPNANVVAAYSQGDYNKHGIEHDSKEKEIEPLVAAEQMPELIGGLAALQKKVKYPEMARKAKIQGRVLVQFIVDQHGKVLHPRVIRGIGGGADEEALRVVKLAKFKPGRQNGKPVPVQYSLPIMFRL